MELQPAFFSHTEFHFECFDLVVDLQRFGSVGGGHEFLIELRALGIERADGAFDIF